MDKRVNEKLYVDYLKMEVLSGMAERTRRIVLKPGMEQL